MKFLDYLGTQDPSFAADPAATAALFKEAALFWDLAPWEVLSESEPIDVEGIAPEPLRIQVRGDEEEPGVMLLQKGLEHPRAWLQFEREVGPLLTGQIEEHGWKLGQPDAIPVAAERGQVATPTTMALLARAMHAVARFLKAGLDDRDEVQGHQLKLPSGLKVWVTWKADADVFGKPVPKPAKATEKKEPGPAPITREKKPGRNDPCWCGSGQKYKKCHLAQDEAQSRG